MGRNVYQVPAGTSYTVTVPVGVADGQVSLSWLSPNTVTATLTGAVAATATLSPTAPGQSWALASQEAVTVALSGANVAGMLAVTTGPPVPSRIPTVPLAGIYNVRDFGAVGDGVTDDTAAILAAAANAGEVFFPQGDYATSGYVPPISGKRIVFQGAAQGAKITNTALTSSNETCCLYCDGIGQPPGQEWLEVNDLQVVGNSTGGFGIRLDNVSQGILKALQVENFTAPAGWGVGIMFGTDVFDVIVVNPVITGCTTAGISINAACNANVVIGGWLMGTASGWALQIAAGNGNRIIGTIIQGPTNAALGVQLYTGTNNSLEGCWVENNATGVLADGTDHIIEGCFFSSNVVDIEVGANSTNLLVRGCHFDTTPHITLDAGSVGTVFEECTGLTLANITDNSGGKYIVRDCPGINPVGSVTVAVPASGSVVAAAPYDRMFYILTASGATAAVSGGPTNIPLAVGSSVFVPAGETLTPTYTTLTWTVQGL